MIGNTLNPCVSAPQGKMTPDTSGTLTPVQLKTREEVLAAREAFKRGGLWRHGKFLDGGPSPVSDSEYARVAAEKYPMPKITVPREVKFDGLSYRFVNGRFERKSTVDRVWYPSTTFADIAGLKALLGLIDNPTCEVDA